MKRNEKEIKKKIWNMEKGKMSWNVEEKIKCVKGEREMCEMINVISNLHDSVSECHKLLNMDIPLCEKSEIILDFRKSLPLHMKALKCEVSGMSGMSGMCGVGEVNVYRQRMGMRVRDRVRMEGRETEVNRQTASLWISGFNDKTTGRDLLNLFQPIDPKLTQDLVVLRGHYAFINFRDPSAAETAHNRVWNLNGEILDTNVRYPK